MKYAIAGLIISAINVILIIAGITCLVIWLFMPYVSHLTEFLLVFGLIGTGTATGTLLTFIGVPMLIEGFMK